MLTIVFRWERWRIIAVALLGLALGGCSTLRIAYDRGDTLAYWWLDGYVGFTPEQAPAARHAIADWFAWHRRTELPAYQALLDEATREILQDTTPERMCAWSERLRERLDHAVTQALPSAAALAVSLSPAQRERFAQRQAERARKDRDEFDRPDAAARLEASIERSTARAERLYGRLDTAQRALLREALTRSPFDVQGWLDTREARRERLVQVIAHSAGGAPEDAVAPLQALWRDVQTPRETDAQARQRACELAARLHNATTASQRLAAQTRLRGWLDDVQRLAAANQGL